eukprot:7464766-Pyramimonas_sp.AAC.1
MALKRSPKWTSDLRLGVDGVKGVLQIIGGGDVRELVKTKRSGIGQIEFHPIVAELSEEGISFETALQVITDASSR